VEDPSKARGLVRREVVRVVTPGTLIEEAALSAKENQYLCSIYPALEGAGLAVLDLSTGDFRVAELRGQEWPSQLEDACTLLEAKEVLIPEGSMDEFPKLSFLQERPEWKPTISPCDGWAYGHEYATKCLLDQLGTQSLDGFGLSETPLAVRAAGALVHYLRQTQKSALAHINRLALWSLGTTMVLDRATVRNLELVESLEGERGKSLLGVLDLTVTPMGGRLLKNWLLEPLVEREPIEQRQEAVEELFRDHSLRDSLRELLKTVGDIERIVSRICLGTASPRDLIALKLSCSKLPALGDAMEEISASILTEVRSQWDFCSDIVQLIEDAIEPDPPPTLTEGGIIKSGYNEELDELRTIGRETKSIIARLEAQERERTGIPTLKVGYNKVFGYYLEVTKKYRDKVPDHYVAKQTLVGAERYITPELKQYEAKLLGAEERAKALEQELFTKVRDRVKEETIRLQETARRIALLDVLACLAEVAVRYDYVRPNMTNDDLIQISSGRHPVLERLELGERFVPNDALLDTQENAILIITGPNMAGKSTYLRQVALIVLLAQMGSFVPAQEATIGLVDRIFTRIGAQDFLTRGQSTFMVEMNETANILHNATSRSLIILDEIGRGTSTYDGLAIAWSVVEYLHGKEPPRPRTLFATHYHELTELANDLPGVKNYNIAVREWADQIVFLRKVVPGGTDKSYGIQVARLAGLPSSVLERAKEVLAVLEAQALDEEVRLVLSRRDLPAPRQEIQLSLFKPSDYSIVEVLRQVNPEELTPIEALQLLVALKRLLPHS
jgi:DNA mismatch repair protein MutS